LPPGKRDQKREREGDRERERETERERQREKERKICQNLPAAIYSSCPPERRGERVGE